MKVAVRQDGQPGRARLQANLTGERLTEHPQIFVTSLGAMLGLNHDLAPFYKLPKSDPRLAPLAEEFHGLKPQRFPTVFEAVVNGIACQLLSLLVGLLLLSRLAHEYGPGSGTPG